MTTTKGRAGRVPTRGPIPGLQTAGGMLSRLAACGTPVTYSALASELGLAPMGENWPEHPLRRIFAVLDAEDIALRRPLRTVVVVNKETRRPGSGFYRTLSRARNANLVTDAERESAYRAELEAARDHYAIVPVRRDQCVQLSAPAGACTPDTLDSEAESKFTLDANVEVNRPPSGAPTQRRKAESKTA